MPLSARQSDILSTALSEGAVTVEELVSKFGVSAQTIRRDLGELCDAGYLARVHGGAVVPSGVTAIAYGARRALAAEAKARIGAAVAAEIPDGASLFLNIGTTTEAVARALTPRKNLMVITNNLNIVNILAPIHSTRVIVAGGELRPSDGGLTGDATVEAIGQYKVDVAVISTSALDPIDGSIMDYDPAEVRVSQAIIANARRVVLAADRSKFDRTAPVRIARLRDVDAFYTDAPVPELFAERAMAVGCEVHIATE